MKGAFSQIEVTMEDTLAEGDRACIRWSFRAKHTGAGLGFAPTGKTIHLTGITILRADAGHIVEGWQNWDMLAMLEQIQEQSKKAATYIGAS
jgi:predicted ester cyclase